jgi:Raf kinase inhibitor-like YbhB/YbcL family protein
MLRLVLVVLAVVALAAPCRAAGSAGFSIDTSAFIDGGAIPLLDAAAADHCGGRNISPPLRIAGVPANARSLAIVLFDSDANAGKGFVHWVAYGIAPSHTPLPPGFGSQPSAAFVGGTNDAGTTIYFGPCPPLGDPPHHYVFTAYALDVRTSRFAPGLTRGALLAAIAGHTLASASLTATFVRAH